MKLQYNKNAPSTQFQPKDAYTVSLRETIERVLNNPRPFSQMHFESGIEVEEKTEFWHGRNRRYLDRII